MVKIFSVKEKDYAELAQFLADTNRETDTSFWMKRFDHWWTNNPAFSDKRGWIMRADGKIVGFLGNIPTIFNLFKKQVEAFNGTNFIVLEPYRKQSLQLFLKQVKGGPIVFMTSISTKPVEILEAFKIPLLPKSNDKSKYHKRSFIVINLKNILKHNFSKRFVENPSAKPAAKERFGIIFLEKIARNKVSYPLINILSFILNKYQSLRLRKLKKIGCSNVKKFNRVDNSFDDLWNRTKDNYENTNVRSSDVINWYLSNKFNRLFLFGYYNDNKLQGYALFKVNKEGIRKFECVDLWIGSDNKNIVAEIVNAARFYAKENSFNLLVLPHFNNDLGMFFKKMGLFQANLEQRRDYYKLSIDDGKLNLNNSYFVSLQGDQYLW